MPEEIRQHSTPLPIPATRPGPALVAARLISHFMVLKSDMVYIALSEASAIRVAQAVRALHPDMDPLLLPPWDCLPYDRVPPSRHCMGRRMDALRVWMARSSGPRMLITSLDAVLQRIPPVSVIRESWYRLAVGDRFDHAAFRAFTMRTGYIEEGIVDDPGELANREDLIDIYPAGADVPMRIVLDDHGSVAELRSYNPGTQRTESTVDEMIFGPASEAVLAEPAPDRAPELEKVDCQLLQLFDTLDTVFDAIGTAAIGLAQGADERLMTYLDIIDEAREAREEFGGAAIARSLYLGRAEWEEKLHAASVFRLAQGGQQAPGRFWKEADPREAFLDYVKAQLAAGRRILITGQGARFRGLCRRLESAVGRKMRLVESWREIEGAEPGSLLARCCDLDDGFADHTLNLAVIPAAHVVREATTAVDSTVLCEPELRPGNVVVHEDHGVAVLRGIETVVTDGVECDVAQLEYHGGTMLMVPMHEFGKLWRYGSQAGVVGLDRLHTEAWQKKRATVAKDIRAVARHMMRVARERQQTKAAVVVPPSADYARFVSHFPYSETTDQMAAIEAVLADLASGRVMNRLVCGDVGFGKTEVALRAAAAVALSGGQVIVVAPTTVLARQHFSTFQRRFAGTGVEVAMLSRVVPAAEAKQVKAALAAGEVSIVVATQAVLAKDVSFAKLQLLIVDEEQRFGARDKTRLQALAPSLHTLIMSATPIPRTLQTAMVGMREISLLTTAPALRRPVRTSLTAFDRGSARVALLREHRRGGQSFFIAPQIDDLAALEAVITEIVPELSVRVAHGQMPAAEMDEIMVGFAEGHGDILLSTNIIESGLDVPRANTMFVWRADRFGLTQLHQLRGRVGRGKAQGSVYLLLEPGKDVCEQTRMRLSTLIEYDRLGSGLDISLEDLDLRGGGEIVGESQAGHMKVMGISLYQRLLARAVSALRKEPVDVGEAISLNLGLAGSIPADYVNDVTMRLNLYARLMRATTRKAIDDLADEFEDRFGESPQGVEILLRLARLKMQAAAYGISSLDGGPRAIAIGFARAPSRKIVAMLSKPHAPVSRGGRLLYEFPSKDGLERLAFLETLLGC